MDIKKAKQQIKNAMTAYFTKDEYGNYRIPIEKQRPVFLMGPPGIGKTAIIEQIANEMGVGMLSYSMTHHTRQSALGLPVIEHKVYQGREYDVSEYTMSEIIASVYDLMEETGIKEGILFLDEINCVSETLAPIMLQFLQYKVFGKHRVPDGWIVVTAGNPPEYNNSVREFDIVTWDRLKRIDIEPDLDAWKEYAYKAGIHASIMTYLDIKKSDFYKVESTVDGKSFVTARGWEDLSQMIKLYEENELTVDEDLIRQYLQNAAIAKDFASYYDLYNKYKSDYQVDSILAGTVTNEIRTRVDNAGFDERLSLIGLMLESVSDDLRSVIAEQNTLAALQEELKTFRLKVLSDKSSPVGLLNSVIEADKTRLANGIRSNSMSLDKQNELREVISILQKDVELVRGENDGLKAFEITKEDFTRRTGLWKAHGRNAGYRLDNMFLFAEDVFGDGHEMLIIVTELTANYYCAKYISEFGSEKYFEHNKELLFYERQREILSEISDIDLDQLEQEME